MSDERRIDTPHGEGRLVTDRSRHPIATLLVSHGAGVGIDTADLEALARNLPRNGVTVVRFEQPWRVAGRKVATSPKTPRRGPGRGGQPAAHADAAGARGPLGRGPVGGPVRAAARRPAAAWPSRSRCTRRATPRSPGCPSCARRGCRPW